MKIKAIIRWILFIFVGLPITIFITPFYVFSFILWRLFIFKKPKEQIIPIHEPCVKKSSINELGVLDNSDDHNAFTMFGAINFTGLLNLIDKEGNFVRRVDKMKNHIIQNQNWVSGDCVISWCLAFTNDKVEKTPELIKALLNSANQYFKNLGTLSYDKSLDKSDNKNNGDVSNRCANFGINWCPDSDFLQMSQPMLAPQYYTTMCLFALASKYSLKFKIIYWTFFIILGGWFWWIVPVLWTKKLDYVYTRDMLIKSLYVINWSIDNKFSKFIHTYSMKFITYNFPYRNDLWYGLLGESPINKLPKTMNPFFSQQEDATSRVDNLTFGNDRLNPYLSDVIKNLI